MPTREELEDQEHERKKNGFCLCHGRKLCPNDSVFVGYENDQPVFSHINSLAGKRAILRAMLAASEGKG